MNTTALMLEMQKKKTNHLLHLILSLLTIVWVIVWILCAIETNSHNKAIDRKIIAVLAEEGRQICRTQSGK